MQFKSMLAMFVYHSGLFRVRLHKVSANYFFVLMYHRVVPANECGKFLQPGMYVEPDTFEEHLQFLNKYFDIRPIEELYVAEKQKINISNGMPSCYLTFDDGWSDFYRYAFPLLTKYQVPATVFLPTGFIGTNKSLWTERLGHICTQIEVKGSFREFIEFARSRLELDKAKRFYTFEVFYEELVEALKQLREQHILAFLTNIECNFDIEPQIAHRDFLSWEEVQEMVNSGLVTFGSHTENHCILTNLNEEEINYELSSSKQALRTRDLISTAGLAFCYPNGNYNEITVKQLQYENYACAFSTRIGLNSPKTNKYELRRVALHQDISSSLPLLAYRIYSAPIT